MSPSLVALAALVAAAFLVETAAGFGSTVVALTLGGLFFQLPWLMAVMLPVNMVVSAVVLWRDRGAVDLGFLARRVLPAMLGGMALGVAVSQHLPGPKLVRAYAVFVVGLAAGELWLQRRTKTARAPLSGRATLGWLAAGGLAHGVFAASGPLVVYAVGRALPDKRVFRATLAALWLALNGLLLASYALRGALTRETGLTALAMLGPMSLGLLAGDAVHRRLAPARFRTAVFALLLAGGLALLAWG